MNTITTIIISSKDITTGLKKKKDNADFVFKHTWCMLKKTLAKTKWVFIIRNVILPHYICV